MPLHFARCGERRWLPVQWSMSPRTTRRRLQHPVSSLWRRQQPFVRGRHSITTAAACSGRRRRDQSTSLRGSLHLVDLTAKTRVELPQLVPGTQRVSTLCNRIPSEDSGMTFLEFGVSDLGLRLAKNSDEATADVLSRPFFQKHLPLSDCHALAFFSLFQPRCWPLPLPTSRAEKGRARGRQGLRRAPSR